MGFEMLATCLLPGRYCSSPLGSQERESLCPLTHPPRMVLLSYGAGAGEMEQRVPQMSQTLALLTEISWIALNKCFFICPMLRNFQKLKQNFK